MRRALPFLLLPLFLLVLGWPQPAGATPRVPSGGRVSVSSAEAQAADGDSFVLDLSANGRYVLFASQATNLVAGDGNEEQDIFRRDLVTGTTIRVNVADDEAEADDFSSSANMSDDGNRIVFSSDADNLVAGDTLGHRDIFLRDVAAGTTARVSLADNEAQPNDRSFSPDISGDGTKVAFTSDADNLVTGDGNGVGDVFQRDIAAGSTVRVSVSTTEGESDFASVGSAMDQDGSVVVFQTEADDLIGANDQNDLTDIYARNLTSGATFRVSVGVGGVEGDGHSFVGRVSDSGSQFSFESDADNLVPDDGDGHRDSFFRSIAVGGTTERISVDPAGGDGDGASLTATVNGAGTQVAFESRASDLVAGDTNGDEDVFVRDLATDTTRLVSARPGTVVDGGSDSVLMSDNGIFAFTSEATNLVPGDTNGLFDVFVAGEVCDGRVVNVDLNHGGVPSALGDVILGTPEGDTVNGLAGADRFCGGGGDDAFTGGASNDRAFGGPGKDTLKGQDGADRLDGAAGNDVLLGGNQNDALFGVAGNDRLEGGNGNDVLNGGANRDTCKGQTGTDRAASCEVRTGIP